MGDIPTLRDNTIQEVISKVKGLNLEWANIKNVVIQTADIEALAVTSAQINDCSITTLSSGNLAVTGTLTTRGYLKSTIYSANTAG